MGESMTNYRLCIFYGIMLSGSLTSLPATQQGDASCNGVMPLLTAGFFGYLQASFQDCMHSLLWQAHRTLEAVYSISQLPTGFLQWIILPCGVITVKKLKLPVFASRGIAARNRIALSLDLPRRLISVGPLCLPELFQ
mgnify:CR=1 FL=1